MQKRILLTGIGGDIGQSVLRCLLDSKQKDFIVGCDMGEFAAVRKDVDVFCIAPPASDFKRYLNFIKGIVKEYGLNYIIPISEAEIEFYDVNSSIFDDMNVCVLIHSHKIVTTFLDKFLTMEFFRENDILHPKTYCLEQYHNELSFPIFLKPRKGCGGKKNIVVKDEEDLDYFRKKIPDAIVQETVGTLDQEYTVGVFSDGIKIHSIAFKRYLGYGSLTKVAHFLEDQVINDLVERIAKLIDLRGSLNIQMRKTEKGYIPFEVNPRFSSTVYMRHFFGFSDVQWWLDINEGKKINYVSKFSKGTAVKTVGENFFDLCEL